MLPDLRTLAVFLGAALALNLTPGPDMLYVAARSTSEGRRAGIVSALGIGAGTLVHITALALGLSALLSAVPLLYDGVRLAGAAYLVWLGLRALLRPAASASDAPPTPAPLGTIFRQGVVTNVLNPKVALFFLAFLPQFVDPARGSAAAQIVALGLLFDVQGTLVNVLVALAASRAGHALRRGRAARVLHRITGGVFLLLGARLALASGRVR
jgi:threonine/homoserine/homoserine lactone efflux protein